MPSASSNKKPYKVLSGGPYNDYVPEYDSSGNVVRNRHVRYTVGDTIYFTDDEYAAWGPSASKRFEPLSSGDTTRVSATRPYNPYRIRDPYDS